MLPLCSKMTASDCTRPDNSGPIACMSLLRMRVSEANGQAAARTRRRTKTSQKDGCIAGSDENYLSKDFCLPNPLSEAQWKEITDVSKLGIDCEAACAKIAVDDFDPRDSPELWPFVLRSRRRILAELGYDTTSIEELASDHWYRSGDIAQLKKLVKRLEKEYVKITKKNWRLRRQLEKLKRSNDELGY